MCKKVCLFLVFLLITGSAFAAEPNLVGWWKFDETTGTNAADSSGTGLNGTIFGDPNWIAGYHGNAIDLWSDQIGEDGTNDYVDLPIDDLVPTLHNSTFACWVYFRSTGNTNWSRIWDFSSSTGDTFGMFLAPRTGGTGSGTTRFAININSGETQVSATALAANGWHHIAISFREEVNDIYMYIDGVIAGQNTNAALRTPSVLYSPTIALDDCFMGRSAYDADTYLNGSIDDFRIYNKYMSVDDIEAISDHRDAWLRSPANNSQDANTTLTLKWYPGFYRAAVNGSKVYLSTSWAAVNDMNDMNTPPIYATDPCTTVNLLPDTTYYWRVVEVNGATTWPRNQIWSFRVDAEASQPQPAPGQGGILTNLPQITWFPHPAATGQKIIFSKVFADVTDLLPVRAALHCQAAQRIAIAPLPNPLTFRQNISGESIHK